MNDRVKKLCERVIKSIKEKPYQWGFWIAFVLVLIPILIWLSYFIGDCGFVWINTSLSVGDFLGFYGAILSFIGTTFLGIVAFKQNEHHNREQDYSEKANTLTPFLTIKEVSKNGNQAGFEKSHYKIKGLKANVVIENVGQGIATRLYYKHWFGVFKNPEDDQMSINLGVNQTHSIRLVMRETDENKLKYKDIYYQNMVGFMYKQRLSYKLVSIPKQVDDEGIDEFYIHVYLMGNQERLGMVKSNTP